MYVYIYIHIYIYTYWRNQTWLQNLSQWKLERKNRPINQGLSFAMFHYRRLTNKNGEFTRHNYDPLAGIVIHKSTKKMISWAKLGLNRWMCYGVGDLVIATLAIALLGPRGVSMWIATRRKQWEHWLIMGILTGRINGDVRGRTRRNKARLA